MTQPSKPRRPSLQEPISLEALAERSDPITELHAAHETAAVLLHTGQAATDPAVVSRLVALVDDVGLPTLAELWASRPASTLPGALYRLYLLHQWMTQDSDIVAVEYAAGLEASTDVARPTPDEVRTDADEILRGAFTGDFADALERAASFCRIVVAGRAASPTTVESAGKLAHLADELDACARLWRTDELH